MYTTSVVPPMPRLRTTGLRLAAIGPDRWRVLDHGGLIIGHVDARAETRGIRYRTLRYHSATRSLIEVGRFWSIDDAVESLRRR